MFFVCFKNIKSGEFCKTRNFFEKKHGICKKSTFLERGIFEKHGIFLGNSR